MWSPAARFSRRASPGQQSAARNPGVAGGADEFDGGEPAYTLQPRVAWRTLPIGPYATEKTGDGAETVVTGELWLRTSLVAPHADNSTRVVNGYYNTFDHCKFESNQATYGGGGNNGRGRVPIKLCTIGSTA